MSDLLRSDFCKQRRLRVNKALDVEPPAGDHPLVGATSLGCRLPITHAAETSGPILSRVNERNGEVISALLSSANETDLANPQPSMWLSGAPSGVLVSTATLPYPAAAPSVTTTLLLGGAPAIVPPAAPKGFGSGSRIHRTLLLPNGMEVRSDHFLADHRMKTYLRIPTTGDTTEPLGLNYSDATDVETNLGAPSPFFRWAFQYANMLTITPIGAVLLVKEVGNQTWTVRAELHFWAVSPSRVGHQPLVLSGSSGTISAAQLALAQGGNNNGPGQDRKNSYFPVDDFTCPGYGGSHSSLLTLTGLRSKLLLYTQGLQNYSVATFNGQGLAPSSWSRPTPQWDLQSVALIPGPGSVHLNKLESTAEVFTGGFNPHSVSVFGPMDNVSLLDINPADITLTIQLRAGTVHGQDFSSGSIITRTVSLPKNPGENLWVEGAIVWVLEKVGPP